MTFRKIMRLKSFLPFGISDSLVLLILLLLFPSQCLSFGPFQNRVATPDPYFSAPSTPKKSLPSSVSPDPRLTESSSALLSPSSAPSSDDWDTPATRPFQNSKKLTPFQPTKQQLRPLSSTPGVTSLTQPVEKQQTFEPSQNGRNTAPLRPLTYDEGRPFLNAGNGLRGDSSNNDFSNSIIRQPGSSTGRSVTNQDANSIRQPMIAPVTRPDRSLGPNTITNQFVVQPRKPFEVAELSTPSKPTNEEFNQLRPVENRTTKPSIQVYSSEVLLNDGTKPLNESTVVESIENKSHTSRLNDFRIDQPSASAPPSKRSIAQNEQHASGTSFASNSKTAQVSFNGDSTESFGPTDNTVERRSRPVQTKPDAKDESRSRNAESNRSAFAPGQVLALVGGEPIFRGDVLYQVNQLLQRLPTQRSRRGAQQTS